MPAAVQVGLGLGALGGAMKSGPDMDMFGRKQAGAAFDVYKNLVGKGAGESDVTAALGASRAYAEQLNNTASSGLYDQSKGNQLAEQQFAGQRQSLAQSLQDQMAIANRAASSAGRSSNDPILRARLGAEAMRQTASLNAQQSSAAQDLGRQSTLDMLSLGGQRVNMLQGLADQAFNGQQNLFSMGQNIQSMDYNAAQYEASRGGGLKGAITGGITGAAAGLQFASGFSQMSNASKVATATAGAMDRMGQPGSSTGGGGMSSGMTPYNGGAIYPTSPFPSAPQYGPSSPAMLSQAGMLPNGWNYGTQFGPGNGPNPAYFDRANFAPTSPGWNNGFTYGSR